MRCRSPIACEYPRGYSHGETHYQPGQTGNDGNQQLVIRICGGKLILNEPERYTASRQQPKLFKDIHSISPEPGYRSGKDNVKLALPAVIHHPVEMFLIL